MDMGCTHKVITEVVHGSVERAVEAVSKLSNPDREGLVNSIAIRHSSQTEVGPIVVVGERESKTTVICVTTLVGLSPSCDRSMPDKNLGTYPHFLAAVCSKLDVNCIELLLVL